MMKNVLLKKAKTMALNAGYHDVQEISTWNGFIVIEPIFTDELEHYIGYPQFLLIKGEEVRWATPDECLQIM